jgi:hypothetical protein
VAEAVGIHIREFLVEHGKPPKRGSKKQPATTKVQKQLAQQLQKLAQLSLPELQRLSTKEFIRGWHALLDLFPHLHPANAREHGTDIEESFCQRDIDVIGRQRYSRSGWPVALELIGREALRRYEKSQLLESELYGMRPVSVCLT